MKIIGITGGVGSGKSEVLKLLEGEYGACVCQADLVARNLEKKGTICYRAIREHFGETILDEKGRIDRAKLAAVIFRDEKERQTLNGIVHPAVKNRIRKEIRKQEKRGTELFVIEAALLLEDHYDEICDETWFIYASDEVRRKRLKLSRSYSDEKIDRMFDAQLGWDEFMDRCSRAVDNGGSFEETWRQVDAILRGTGN